MENWINGKERLITANQFAVKHGVSRQRVMVWIHTGRLAHYHPADRTYLIRESEKSPEPRRGGRPVSKKHLDYQ